MEEELIGQRVWFPSAWEQGEIYSVLHGDGGSVLAYVIRKDDGKLVTIDMQVVEQRGEG